jgi:hypothetical protein
MIRFLETQFARIDIVNTVQGFLLSSKLPVSLHVPLVPVTTTRYCKWAAAQAGFRNASNYYECTASCADRVDVNANPYYCLYLFGNTQFYVNWRLPRRLPGVDRIVRHIFGAVASRL